MDAVTQYLSDLPPDRRGALAAVREVILAHIPAGYEEAVAFGGIIYCVPLRRFSRTYNGRPLTLAALVPRKGYLSLFLMPFFWDHSLGEWFAEEYRKSGKKLAMGRGCVRFRTADDLPLELIGKVIGLIDVDKYVAVHEAVHSRRGAAGPSHL